MTIGQSRSRLSSFCISQSPFSAMSTSYSLGLWTTNCSGMYLSVCLISTPWPTMTQSWVLSGWQRVQARSSSADQIDSIVIWSTLTHWQRVLCVKWTIKLKFHGNFCSQNTFTSFQLLVYNHHHVVQIPHGSFDDRRHYNQEQSRDVCTYEKSCTPYVSFRSNEGVLCPTCPWRCWSNRHRRYSHYQTRVSCSGVSTVFFSTDLW